MDDIRQWLEQIGLDKYAELFAEQRIGYDVIGELSEQDLKEFGLPFGDRKRLLREIQLLDESAIEPAVGVNASKAEHLDTAGGAERRQLTVMFCDLVGFYRTVTAI